MPIYAYERLQSNIQRVKAALESRQILPAQLCVSTIHTSVLLKCMVSWRREVDTLCDAPTAI